MSLQNKIQNVLYEVYLRNPDDWTNGGEVERMALNNGYKASNASRRMRELANEGILDRKIEAGSVWYRYVPKLVPVV